MGIRTFIAGLRSTRCSYCDAELVSAPSFGILVCDRDECVEASEMERMAGA